MSFRTHVQLVFKAKGMLCDYHHEINSLTFENCLNEKQNLSIVVMVNGPYHSVKVYKALMS
jgi:hypothetical protein